MFNKPHRWMMAVGEAVALENSSNKKLNAVKLTFAAVTACFLIGVVTAVVVWLALGFGLYGRLILGFAVGVGVVVYVLSRPWKADEAWDVLKDKKTA